MTEKGLKRIYWWTFFVPRICYRIIFGVCCCFNLWNRLFNNSTNYFVKALISEFDRLNLWDVIDSWGWRNILISQPYLADKCNKWNEFDLWDWFCLLKIQPQLAGKCNKWNEFNSRDWFYLLETQPQFADKCPEKFYDVFTRTEWDELETKHPNIFVKKRMLSTLRKLGNA